MTRWPPPDRPSAPWLSDVPRSVGQDETVDIPADQVKSAAPEGIPAREPARERGSAERGGAGREGRAARDGRDGPRGRRGTGRADGRQRAPETPESGPDSVWHAGQRRDQPFGQAPRSAFPDLDTADRALA